MDMLDFESEELYFDEALNEEAKACIEKAAEGYADDQAYEPLMRAYFLEPEHPVVLVALYRFFYYQHKLADALIVAERALKIFAERLDLPEDWRDLEEAHLLKPATDSMTKVRFYLWTLKGAAYLELRLGKHETAMARLEKLLELDDKNHLGAEVLLDVANEVINNVYRLRTA